MQEQDTRIVQVFKARAFAVAAHGDQKYGGAPYVTHLDDVAELCLKHLGDMFVSVNCGDGFRRFSPVVIDCLVAAYLHDVLEDTPVREADVEAAFGPSALKQAAALSDPPGKNRKERKELLHERLALLDERDKDDLIVLGVKTMDRLANLKKSAATNPDLLEMYRKEAPAFRKAVFRAGIFGQAWAEIDCLCV